MRELTIEEMDQVAGGECYISFLGAAMAATITVITVALAPVGAAGAIAYGIGAACIYVLPDLMEANREAWAIWAESMMGC